MATAARGPLANVTLVDARPDGIDLVFSPSEWRLDTISATSVMPRFNGSQLLPLPGAPAYPLRSVLVAVPPAGDISVTASPADWRRISSLPVALLPAAPDRGAARAATTEIPPLLRWEGPFWVRDLRLVRIWLAPAQPVAGGIMVTDRIDVQVHWSAPTGSGRVTPNPIFDPMLSATVVNFAQAQTYGSRVRSTAIDNPFAVASEWYKISVTADGPHRITRTQLSAAGFPISASDPRSYRMYYAGGLTLPVLNTEPRPQLREIPIEVTGSADGSFDASDVIYFFGQAADRWENRDSTARYVTNPYMREITYWLVPQASGGQPLRIATIAAAPGADVPTTIGIGRAAVEQNRVLNLKDDDYYTWYWQNADSASLLLNLPNAVFGQSGTVTVATLPEAGAGSPRIDVNGSAATFLVRVGRRYEFSTSSLLPTTTVELSYTLGGEGWIDRAEAEYPQMLIAGSAGSEFWLGSGSGNHIQVRNVQSGMVTWDITRPDSPFAVSGVLRSDTLEFDPGPITTERRYRLWVRSQAAVPNAIRAATPGLLRQTPVAADMLLLGPPSLLAPLDAYRTHREQQSGITVELVDVTQVYDDFGFGQFDPVALRDFLKYTYENAVPRPSAVILVGDGSYDFQGFLATESPQLVPPFVVDPLFDNTSGDQNYVSFGTFGTLDVDTSRVNLGDRGWDMMISRWPVRNSSEARTVANKIIAYESDPEFGLWRNRMVLVADDEFGEPPSSAEFFHTRQCEGIGTHIPATYDIHKIYLFEYAFDAAREKPGAREDLVEAWNEGMLLVDYVGHGSPNVWAHEDVFRRSQDLPRLANGARLPLVYTASCSIGFFDDPVGQGMGEELFRRAGGGAIGIISATRSVFSQPNVDLNEAVFDLMLGTTPALSVGQSLFGALVQRQYNGSLVPTPKENDRKHVLFGDPLMHLARPTLSVSFDSAGVPDSLVALQTARVAGQVVDSGGQPVNLGGQLLLSVHDAPRERIYQSGVTTVPYTLAGRPIFAGTYNTLSADFDLSFVVPKDVSYGEDGARVVVYAEGDQADALGVRAPIPVSAEGTTTSDVTGPTWELTINGETPVGRWQVTPADEWQARITDPLGINITGGGHGISVTVDADEFSRQDITPLFTYDVGSFSTGSVDFKLPHLEPGDHELRLMAWDNANNPGELRVSVAATGEMQFEVRDFLIYPNPFDPDQAPARLTYELSFPPDRVQLSVYTVAGNKIRTLREPAPQIGFNYGVLWDGRDDVGDLAAAGIYLVALEVEGFGRKVEDFTKIVLIRSD